jgi:hypothetical protein
MTRHRPRYPIALLLVALSGCSLLSKSGPLAPPPPATGTDVLQRMSSRYEGKWFQTLQFTQENTRYAANGRTERSQWKVNILLVLTADVYAQPVAMSSGQLATLGVDLTKLRSDMWNDRKVWVVGSTIATDLATPQFWVDADTWVVLRVIERAAQGTASAPRPSTEYRLGDYRVLSGVPVVHEIQFLRDGQPFFKEQYTDVQLNTAIDARLFSASQWKIPVRTP